MFGKRENISADIRVSSILRDNFCFFREKSSIYRRFFQFIGDLSPIFVEMTRVLGS